MKTVKALCVAAAALAIAGCSFQARLPRGAVYLPADAAFVLSLDLQALASTDLYKELEQRGGAVALNRLNFLKFAQVAGIDPVKDVRWLTFSGRGASEIGPGIDELSAVVSGTFDGKRIDDFLKDSGLPFESHMDLDIYQVVMVEGRCRLCIAILDDTTAAFGDGETLRAMAEGRGNPDLSLPGDETARRLLSRVDTRAAIWGLVRGKDFAGPFADLMTRLAGGSATAEAIGTVRDVAFFVSAGRDVTVAVDALARSSEDALIVADILEGAGAIGKLALKQAKPEASQLLTTFRVQVDGELLRASTSFPQASLLELSRTFASDVLGGSRFAGPLMGLESLGGSDRGPIPAITIPPAPPEGSAPEGSAEEEED